FDSPAANQHHPTPPEPDRFHVPDGANCETAPPDEMPEKPSTNCHHALESCRRDLLLAPHDPRDCDASELGCAARLQIQPCAFVSALVSPYVPIPCRLRRSSATTYR